MLRLENVSLEVAGENGNREIVKNISFTVEEGGFAVITGPNGGGKSTLAKIIAGVIRPTEGRVFFDGADITGLSITDRARMGIGFAFQQPVRFKGVTVRDLITIAAGQPLATEAACVYLSQVGLCAIDYIDRELDASLSGGELKRIEIASILARGTRLSVFDEPEAGIDLWSFQNLIRVFTHMRDKTKGAVVIISHQERILEIADRIIVVSGGRVTKEGSRDEVLPELLSGSDACRFFKAEGVTA